MIYNTHTQHSHDNAEPHTTHIVIMGNTVISDKSLSQRLTAYTTVTTMHCYTPTTHTKSVSNTVINDKSLKDL